MSNTANGISGTAQNQAAAKDKAGHGKTAGTAAKNGDFALTVANLAGRGGEGGRKGANLSISAGIAATRSVPADQAGDTRARTSYSNLPGIAEVLRKAGIEVAEKAAVKARELANAKTDARTGAKTDQQIGVKVDAQVVVKAGAVARQGNALPGEKVDAKAVARPEGKAAAETGVKAETGSGAKTAVQVSARADADPIAKTGSVFAEKVPELHALADKQSEKPRAETRDAIKAGPVDLKPDQTVTLGGSGNPANPVVLGNPDKSVVIDSSGKIVNSVALGKPENPVALGSFGNPANSVVFDNPDKSVVIDSSGKIVNSVALGKPENPVALGSFGNPANSVVLDNPDKSVALDSSDKPVNSVALDNFGKPDNSRKLDKSDESDKSEKAGDAVSSAVPDAGSKADVGNLLALLATPSAAAQVVANSQAAAASVTTGGENGNEQPDGRVADWIDVGAEGSSALANVTHDSGAAADAAAAMPESDIDQLFRLIRADGKGRDVDMSISADGERTTVRDADPTGPKGETVTVVDARRYIGLASTSNAAAVTTALTQDPAWAASLSATGGLVHAHPAATGKVVNMLKIQMHPIELGLVTATLRLHGDELTVSLQVQTAEAYRQLSDDQDAMVKALRDQGFAVDQVTVQLTPADRNPDTLQGDGQSPQQQPQFSSQPQAREGGNGRQGAEGQAARNFGRKEASHEGTTSDNAAGLAGSQSLRTGGVYL